MPAFRFHFSPRSALVPVLIFLILGTALGVTVAISSRTPVIHAISPRFAEPGDSITITGRHFGDERGRNSVSIAGRTPTQSAYLSWSDTEIQMRLPHSVGSGVVYVTTPQGRSNGVLFGNLRVVPDSPPDHPLPGIPVISSVSPTSAQVGSTVTITGRFFGPTRGAGVVRFPASGDNRFDPFVEVSSRESGYLEWSETRIRVVVPDGAASGPIVVETDRGSGAGHPIEITTPPGTKTYSSPTTFAVQYRVRVATPKPVSVDRAENEGPTDGTDAADNGDAAVAVIEHPQGFVGVWLPRIAVGPAQRALQVVSEKAPATFERDAESEFVRLSRPPLGEHIDIERTVLFHRYAVETVIVAARVEERYQAPAAFIREYTSADAYLPVDDATIARTVQQVVGNQRNPYLKAQAVFSYVLARLGPDPGVTLDPVAAISERRGDAFTYARLMTTLLRRAGVPARIVSGFFVTVDLEPVRHHWLEFSIPGFGWVPADPAAADGLLGESVSELVAGDPVRYYFGNVDNRRVEFTRGVVELPSILRNGRAMRPEAPYALQSVYVEYTGPEGLIVVSWPDVSVIGEY